MLRSYWKFSQFCLKSSWHTVTNQSPCSYLSIEPGHTQTNKIVNRQTCLSCSSPLFTFFSTSFMETFSAYFVNLGQVLIFERGDLLNLIQVFCIETRTGQQTDEWFSLFGTEIMGGLHSSHWAEIADQEDSGELGKDDQHRGQGIFKVPLQSVILFSLLRITLAWNVKYALKVWINQ